MSGYLRNAASIVGVGETEYCKVGRATRSEFELACMAVMRAVADAGLELSDVDGLCTYAGERSAPIALAPALGMNDLRFVNLYPGGGNAAGGIVHNAALAVAAGAATTIVCYRSLCQGQFQRFGRARAGQGLSAQPMSTSIGGPQAFTAPFGLFSPAQTYALDARRHMHEFGTTSAQFGAVAVASYANAQRNPRAVMYGRPLTLEQHQASRLIADPYRLYDCCQESDGACAVVVTSTERAAGLRHRRVLITAGAQGMVRGDGIERQSRPASLWTTAGLTSVARQLYREAGIGPEDIDVVAGLRELHRPGHHGARGLRLLRARRRRTLRRVWSHRLAGRQPADQHLGWEPRRGLHPRVEPRDRGCPAAARDLDLAGRGRRRIAWS